MSIYKLLKQRSLLLLASLMLAFSAYSQIPSKPNPYRLINDFAGIFTSAQIEDLESIARNFRDSTSNEICIVTVKDLGDYDRSQFAYEIGQTWGVGDKKFDNGVVLLIVPKSKSANGQVFIATGYGLEGALPDIECSNIIRQILIPSFQRNDYYTGTRQALLKIGQIASGEYNEAIDEDNDISDIGIFIAIIFWIIIIIIISNNNNNNKNNNSRNGGNRPVIFYGPTHTTWNSGSFSRGGFSGGSFGGGSFGGGGAGGSW